MNVDVISDILKGNALSVIRIIRFLREQDFFKKIDKKNYHFWFDLGTHHRNQEMNFFLLKDLSIEKNVEINFFMNKHGNNFNRLFIPIP